MKRFAVIAAILGLTLFSVLLAYSGLGEVAEAVASAGWATALVVLARAGLADVAVLGRGVPVAHLMPDGRLAPHRPSEGAVLGDDGEVRWPAQELRSGT